MQWWGDPFGQRRLELLLASCMRMQVTTRDHLRRRSELDFGVRGGVGPLAWLAGRCCERRWVMVVEKSGVREEDEVVGEMML